MIYFYRHKRFDEFTSTEIDLMGYDGVKQFANEHNLDAQDVFAQIKLLEKQIDEIKTIPLNLDEPLAQKALQDSVNSYIDFFNKYATFHKQAYILVGNVGSGKSTYAREIEEPSGSIILDSDHFKIGADTPNGYFYGLSSFYSPEDRERLQKPSSIACSMASEKIANTGMNVILPNAPFSIDKLESKIKAFTDKNYDIHLIYFDAPYNELTDRVYYRYLIQEYEQKKDANGNLIHGRFVPLSVVKKLGDSGHETFAKAYKQGRYKSYKAYYNDKTIDGREEIDLKTMI